MSMHNGARSHASEVAAAHKSRIAAGNASRLAAAGLALFLTFGFSGVAQADAGGVPNDKAGTEAGGVDNAGHASEVAFENAAGAQTTTAPVPTPPGGEAGTTGAVTAAATPSAESTTSQPEPVLESSNSTETSEVDDTAPVESGGDTVPVQAVQVAAPSVNNVNNVGSQAGNSDGQQVVWVTICHQLGNDRWETRTVAEAAQGEAGLAHHLGHGDSIGACATGPDDGGGNNGGGTGGNNGGGTGGNNGGGNNGGGNCPETSQNPSCDEPPLCTDNPESPDCIVECPEGSEDPGCQEPEICETQPTHPDCDGGINPGGGGTNPGDGGTNPGDGGGGTPGGGDVENPLPGEGDDVEGPAGPGKPKPGKPGTGGKGDDEVLGEDTDKPRDKGGKPGSNGGDPEGDPGFPDEILGVDDTPVAKRPATVLPQTGAAENMAIQAGGGLTLLLTGALLLVGRRRQTDG